MASKPEAAGSGRYSSVAILLHWLIAAAIVMQLVLGLRMQGPRTPDSFALTQLHKSIGVTILLLSLARLTWRLMNPPPPLPQTMPAWERGLARVTHAALYGIMIGMPLTGWLMVSASRTRIPTLLYGTVPWPNLPVPTAARPLWHEVGEQGHELLAWGAAALLLLHVAGALKHQLASRDEPVLARMAPGAVAGRWADPRLILILAAVLAIAGFAYVVRPPRPGVAPPPAAIASQATEPAEAPSPAEPAPAPAATPAAPAAPGEVARWAVQPGSTLGFSTAWSGTAIQGRFERWTADIRFDPQALDRSQVAVSVDMTSAVSGDKQRDETLPAPDWFDAAAHPRAVFTASRFEAAGGDRYVARGTLKLKGVSRPLSLPFQLTIDGDKAHARGTASLDRTVFGVGQGDFADTSQIPAKVTIRFDLRAARDQR